VIVDIDGRITYKFGTDYQKRVISVQHFSKKFDIQMILIKVRQCPIHVKMMLEVCVDLHLAEIAP
jgi:hypothetical protein